MEQWKATSGKKFFEALRRQGWRVLVGPDSMLATKGNKRVRLPFDKAHIMPADHTQFWGWMTGLTPADLR